MSAETVEAWLGRAAALLAAAGVPDPRLEARLLLGAATGQRPETLFALRGERIGEDSRHRADSMLERRRRREPASHILGRREFWGLELQVTGEVLDPRPDSETLVAATLSRIQDRDQPLRVLDLGTGTGCLLLAVVSELPNAQGLGVDVSLAAVRIAEANSARLGLSARARFAVGDWGAGLSGGWDVILSNPPYIRTEEIALLQPEVSEWEPRLALDGGADGLGAYRRMVPDAARLLADKGFAAVEIGFDQAAAVGALCRRAGLPVLECVRDLAGRDRCLVLARSPA